jgi:hypothetical protein
MLAKLWFNMIKCTITGNKSATNHVIFQLRNIRFDLAVISVNLKVWTLAELLKLTPTMDWNVKQRQPEGMDTG